ncbi:aminotransferase class V-fold PLP-dependent enzyme [Bosea beijingensis]|uniref:aminotransferase class V-fold PLP-dependent enzyme n=1 Tax=Bosea beijingensis TaxID=3068632 RepID=UPI002741E9D9|nr:aminotransferase class V-fold PLP-dependent enzyme [Bosea sp. REN20]
MITVSSPPAFGAAIRDQWLLDPNKLTVNHGAYGATPKVVLAAQDEWRRRMEAQPSLFMRLTLPPALRAAADALARFVGAEGRDLVFADNATSGCNAVLRSLDFTAGDEILILSHAYGAVRNTIRYLAERHRLKIVEAQIAFPQPDAGQIVAAVATALTKRTRVAVLDHITSSSALVMPIARLVALCRDAGVPVLIDGAHAPAQIDLDLTAIGADWYVGNCHKWLMAPKGCAFLWARRDRQGQIHPLTISHGFGGGYVAEFDWTGTRDPSAFLAVEAALAFHDTLGGGALRARNKALAERGAAILASALGTAVGASPAYSGAMQLVRLPINSPATPEGALAARHELEVRGCDAPVSAIDGGLWLRLSAQAYNEEADFEKLAWIVKSFCQ